MRRVSLCYSIGGSTVGITAVAGAATLLLDDHHIRPKHHRVVGAHVVGVSDGTLVVAELVVLNTKLLMSLEKNLRRKAGELLGLRLFGRCSTTTIALQNRTLA